MGKVDTDRIAAIKAKFETGDTPTQADFADLIDALAEAAQDHQHAPSGGSGSGTGDAAPVANLKSGTAAQKPATPEVGDVYLETDTSKLFACFSAGSWTDITGGISGAPTDASYVTINAEPGLSAETLHAQISGEALHDPKAHTHTESDVTDLDHDAQKIKGHTVVAPQAGDDGKFLQYDHAGSQYLHAEAMPGLPAVGAGDNLCVSADAEKQTSSTEYLKVKEIRVYRPGTYRIKFDLRMYGEDLTAYGRVYKNGSPVGIERSNATINWTTFSEDIGGWEESDLVQLYYRQQGGTGVETVITRNFRLYYDAGPLDGYAILN